MIGFLCNSKEIVNYYTYYYNSFKTIIEKNIPIAFFTINNIDFNNRKVLGITVSKGGIKSSEIQIPRIVFNFSKQCKKDNIKKLKLLCEMEEIKIINEANRFNQFMIMEILSSLDSTKKYILPYYKSGEKEIGVDYETEYSFLVIPKVGSSLNRTIYIEQLQAYLGINNTVHFPYCEENQMKSKIIIPFNRSLIIKCPKLIVGESRLAVVRIYVQKVSKNLWKYLYSSNVNKNIIEQSIMNDLKNISIESISYINNYIPSIGIGFIDFIFDEKMNPYFLHLGGWDRKLLHKKGEKSLHKEFCENLIQCYEYYGFKSQED